MKKLYNGKGKRIHPSPPSSPFSFLSALPAALLTLAAALSPEEKEVLVYLLSDTASGKKKPLQSPLPQRKNHPPELGCGCFGCYKSFWARWDSSPNHHLIHHILDAVEQSLEPQSVPSARRRRRRRGRRKDSGEEASPPAAAEASNPADEDGDDEGYDENAGEGEEEEEEEEFDGGDGRSPVRRLVSFIGERVWGVWNC